MNERPTHASIDENRRYQLEERERVFRATGLRILDTAPAYSEMCRRCDFVALAPSPYGAANLLARHIVRVHLAACLGRTQ